MIVYSAADLVWATRIKSTAEAVGVEARPVRSVEMLDARLGDSEVRGLIVDLEAAEVGLELIRAAGEDLRARGVRVVAFGPHVAVETLQAARDAGAHEVMPRGAFSNALPDLLVALEAGSGR